MYRLLRSSYKRLPAFSSASSSGTKVQVHARQVNDSLFELHKPPGTAQMQVLFFHGLQFENSSDMHLSTWECGDGSCWPQTWLVEEFPGAHVLCVSYNGAIKDSRGVLDMYRVGENLTSDLIQANIGQMVDCPVILVGHSFGGLVIQQLCSQAHAKLSLRRLGSEKKKLEAFLGNIRGVFYYATPRHGSLIVEKMTQTEDNPLLKYFKILSTKTVRLKHQFDQLHALHGKWKIYGLGESLKTKLSGLRDDVILVSEASARVGDFYTVSGVDHYSICKPLSKTSGSFLKLKDFLCNIAGDMEEEGNICKEGKASEDNCPDNFQYLPESIVGLEYPLQEITKLLENVTAVGIGGMGGLGKTTLAMTTFNKLGDQFEYSCFVNEVKLIEQRKDTMRETVWKLMHRHGKKVGKEERWSSLRGKRLFLVLDDISNDDDLEVLSKLVNDTSLESRFIVTSRDQKLLSKLDEIYNVSLLDESAAKELFLSHAFEKQGGPSLELQDLVDNIVRKCDGLPLALEVLGKSLHKQGYREVWEQTLHALVNADVVRDLDDKLWAKLRVSYDRLKEVEQNIFLDAATFFSGNWSWTLRDAKAAWRVVYDTKIERLLWQTLVDLSLVYNVKEDEIIKVHEQLRSLGRKMASEPSNNAKRRICGTSALKLLQTASVLDEQEIHALSMDTNSNSDEDGILIASNALDKLKNLHYLDVNVPIIIAGAQKWTSFPTKLALLKCAAPENIHVLFHPTLRDSLVGLKLENLQSARMPNSKGYVSALVDCLLCSTADVGRNSTPMQRMLNEIGKFSQLEVLELGRSPCLRTLPETFGQLFKLRHLKFNACHNFCTLPESFGKLKALSSLVLYRCSTLHSLPKSFGELSSLNHLEFVDTPELDNLPQSFGQLQALSHLEFISCSKLQSLPKSFGNLSSLRHLEFSHCDKLGNLPESFGQLLALSHLEFRSCEKLHSLPKSFGDLQALNYLAFRGSEKLHTLPEGLNYLGFRQLTRDEFSRTIFIASRWNLEGV